jgi:hypothetical protein
MNRRRNLLSCSRIPLDVDRQATCQNPGRRYGWHRPGVTGYTLVLGYAFDI